MGGEPAGARPRFAAGNHTDPAVVEFEIERGAGVDFLRCRDDAGDSVAHHDIAARQKAFVAFRMGGEPSGKIIDTLMTAPQEGYHRR